MTLQNDNKDAFSLLIGDYTAWGAQVLKLAFYDDVASRLAIIPPEWPLFQENEAGNSTRLFEIRDNVHAIATEILAAEGAPTRATYEFFTSSFERLIDELQNLAQGKIYAEFGIDELTGLPTKDRMYEDLERELERRARRGEPFCVIISCIDGDSERADVQNIALAANALKKTIRTFDDVYVMGEGQFLTCLKHTDNGGALKFVARLKNALIDTAHANFTMTSLTAEPLPGDNLKALVEDVQQATFDIMQEEKGTSAQYEETSPLARYLQSIKE